MATVVYQGLRSCLESQLSEPRALRLRLSSPSPHFELALKSCFLDSSAVEETNKQNDHADSGGWSFLQALSCGPPLSNPSSEKERTYVHPQAKRSLSPTLSEKSLALCTENLGNETGSDVTETDDIFSVTSHAVEKGNCRTRKSVLKSRKGNANQSFPPPLTSMRGCEGIQVRPHREDGRLVLKATKVPPPTSCFEAERSHGRLRLCLLKDEPPSFDLQDKEDEETSEHENDTAFEEVDEERERLGMETLNRPGRCAEGDQEKRGLLNWEPFWVATS